VWKKGRLQQTFSVGAYMSMIRVSKSERGFRQRAYNSSLQYCLDSSCKCPSRILLLRLLNRSSIYPTVVELMNHRTSTVSPVSVPLSQCVDKDVTAVQVVSDIDHYSIATQHPSTVKVWLTEPAWPYWPGTTCVSFRSLQSLNPLSALLTSQAFSELRNCKDQSQ